MGNKFFVRLSVMAEWSGFVIRRTKVLDIPDPSPSARAAGTVWRT